LSSDQLAVKRGKSLDNDYLKRFSSLESAIEKNFPNSSYEISKLENDFGPAVVEGSVKALVVSEETSAKGLHLNELRAERNLSPVEIVVVPMILAEDGKAISSTRIKNSEIDSSGNLN
jgi:pantetheine-phosphate adenylyltransferase